MKRAIKQLGLSLVPGGRTDRNNGIAFFNTQLLLKQNGKTF